MSSQQLTLLEPSLAICRLSPADGLPGWVHNDTLYSVTQTAEELSIVVPAGLVPAGTRAESGWRALRVRGPLEFSQIGVLSSLLGPLADARVSVFALSTFDTDYLLVREERLDDALDALRRAGHRIS